MRASAATARRASAPTSRVPPVLVSGAPACRPLRPLAAASGGRDAGRPAPSPCSPASGLRATLASGPSREEKLAPPLQPVINIVAPVMAMIMWVDRYDPISVQLGQMAHLQRLRTLCIELPDHQYNWGTLMLLQCFQKIPELYISIVHPPKMVNYRYLMEALTLPPVEDLWLRLVTIGHAVVSCIFHFLKISAGIRRLFLQIHEDIPEQSACLPGCVCHEQQDWKTEELCLNSLEELDICGFSVADCDFAFVKRLLGWTPVLKTVTINFDPSATLNEDLCKELLGLSGPDTSMKIYVYCNGTKVMYTPVGKGSFKSFSCRLLVIKHRV